MKNGETEDFKLSSEWDEYLEAYKEFVCKHKHEPTPKEVYQGRKLGEWVSEQKKKSELPYEKEQALNTTGVFKNKHDARWWYMYNLYIAYKKENDKEENSESIEPKRLTMYKKESLGAWCNTQRQYNRKGMLLANRKRALDEAGFDFSVQSQAKYAETYERCKPLLDEYIEVNSKKPDADAEYEGKKIGLFYKKVLKYESVHRDPTEAIKRKSIPWEENYKLVCEFKKKYNRFPKPEEMYEGSNVGNWVVMQRQLYNNKTLNENQEKKLQQIGFIFSPREEQWKRNYLAYKDFLEVEKREPKGKEIYLGYHIGLWRGNQRASFLSGKLSEERIDLLKKIDSNIIRKSK